MRAQPAAALVCPACAASRPEEERFCTYCGMPLVVAGDAAAAEGPESETHARARKVRPEYARGPLVRVAGGRNQAEAELIHGYLLEEGIPSLVRRSAAFDVPDFLAAGQRDILVPESGSAAARELLVDAEAASAAAEPVGPARGRPGEVSTRRVVTLAAAVLGGGLTATLVAWGLSQIAN